MAISPGRRLAWRTPKKGYDPFLTITLTKKGSYPFFGRQRKRLPGLEHELHRELHDARVARGSNRAEVRRAEHGGRRSERRRVQEVEDFGAQLDRRAADGDAAHQREVH